MKTFSRIVMSGLLAAFLSAPASAQPSAPANSPLVKVAEYKLHHARRGPAVAVQGDYLYIFGGSGGESPIHEAERLHLPTGKIELLAPRFVTRRYHSVVEHEGKFWIFGGQGYQRADVFNEPALEIYDPATDTVTRGDDLKLPRSSAGVIKLGHQVMVIGGNRHRSGGAYAQTNTVDVLDLRDGSWREGPAMPTPREAPAVTVGQFILVAGGYAARQKKTEVEMFVPQEDGWKRLPKLGREISGHSAATLGRWLFLFGDWDDTDTVLAYDLPTRTTTAIKPGYTEARNTAAVTVGDRIYVVGGAGQNTGRTGGGRRQGTAVASGTERALIQVFALNPDYQPR